MARIQEIAIYTNPDGSTGYLALGMKTPEEVGEELKKKGKRDIMIIETRILWWG